MKKEIDEPAKEKRTNVIVVMMYVDGEDYMFRYSAPISQSFIGSQKNRAAMGAILKRALTREFGKVEES